MKRYEAIFKKGVYKFNAPDPRTANDIAKMYRDKKYPGQRFKLFQIGI